MNDDHDPQPAPTTISADYWRDVAYTIATMLCAHPPYDKITPDDIVAGVLRTVGQR